MTNYNTKLNYHPDNAYQPVVRIINDVMMYEARLNCQPVMIANPNYLYPTYDTAVEASKRQENINRVIADIKI